MKHPAPKWVAETRSSGLLSGFAATDVNHAAHCINGNISLSGTTSTGLSDGTGDSTSHTFQSPRWTQSGPRVRMMSLETDLAASSSARDQRSRSPSSAVNRRVGSTAPQMWTRALLDSGADCCVCGDAMTAGRLVALDQLPAGTQLPQSSQGFPMDVTGLRLVTMRLGEFVLEMEFWVCRSCRRTIASTGELLRKGLSCHVIGFDGTDDSREVRVVGSIFTGRWATYIEWCNDHLWVYWDEAGTFWPCAPPPLQLTLRGPPSHWMSHGMFASCWTLAPMCTRVHLPGTLRSLCSGSLLTPNTKVFL